MHWQIAIGLSILANGGTQLIQRRYSQRSQIPATVPPAISYLLGVCPLGIVTGLLMSHHVVWSWWTVGLIALNSLVMACSNFIAFAAVRRLSVVRYQTIGQFYVIVVVVLGWIFLGEGLNRFQLLGAALLLCGALLAIRTPKRAKHGTKHVDGASILLALAAATTLGIALVIEKAALGHMDTGAYLIFGYSAQTVTMLLLAAKDVNRQVLRHLRESEIRWSAGMGWANGITGVLYVLAIVNADNISEVTAVTSITLPLVVLAAYLLLKEREKQGLLWAALGLSFVGLLVGTL